MSLQVTDLHAGYVPGIDILQGLSLVARDGQLTTIIGANGVGKSTLLKCVIGQLGFHRGEIRYRGESLAGLRTAEMVRRGIGYVAQGRNVFPQMTVLENLELGGWSIRRERARLAEGIERALAQAPILAKFRGRKAGELSGGQQRLLEIERSLLTDPELLLIDEPTVGLDPKMSAMIYEHLRGLSEGSRRTILMVDQNVVAGTEVADFIYVLELGANKIAVSKAEFDASYRETIADWLL